MASADQLPADAGAPGEIIQEAQAGEYVADIPWTEEETKKVAAMRKELGNEFSKLHERDRYWVGDSALHRILVARQLDVAAACTMYRHIVDFRNERKLYSILDGPAVYRQPEVMRRYFPWGIAGVDKDGFPLLVERIGHIDLIGIGASCAGADGSYGPYLDWVAWYHEVQERLMREACTVFGQDRHKMTVIVDLGGLSLRHCSTATLSILKKRTRLEEDHYPEVVKRLFLINTPAMFASVWGIVKRFVDPGTAAKFSILAGPESYMPVLKKYIAEDNIPAYLGGKLVDSSGDPECRRMIGGGGVVPLAYLAPVGAAVGSDGRGAGEEVAIPAGKASEVVLHVPAGALVRWTWTTAEKDVQFSATAAPADKSVGSSSASGVISVTRSVCGAHILAPGFDRANAPNPYAVPATAAVAAAEGPIPGQDKGAKAVDCCQSSRASQGTGTWTVPASAGANGMVVRLRWDNGFSWMAGKTVARRVDVILPSDLDKDKEEAGAGGSVLAATAAKDPQASPILKAADPDGDRAWAREHHREDIRALLDARKA